MLPSKLTIPVTCIIIAISYSAITLEITQKIKSDNNSDHSDLHVDYKFLIRKFLISHKFTRTFGSSDEETMHQSTWNGYYYTLNHNIISKEYTNDSYGSNRSLTYLKLRKERNT